jgi:hypothetical protein
MATGQNKPVVVTKTAKPIRSVGDVWENLNTLDAAAIDDAQDIQRTRARIQINHQRLEMIRLALKAGVLSGAQLALPVEAAKA